MATKIMTTKIMATGSPYKPFRTANKPRKKKKTSHCRHSPLKKRHHRRLRKHRLQSSRIMNNPRPHRDLARCP